MSETTNLLFCSFDLDHIDNYKTLTTKHFQGKTTKHYKTKTTKQKLQNKNRNYKTFPKTTKQKLQIKNYKIYMIPKKRKGRCPPNFCVIPS
jgi:hypothetical protein